MPANTPTTPPADAATGSSGSPPGTDSAIVVVTGPDFTTTVETLSNGQPYNFPGWPTTDKIITSPVPSTQNSAFGVTAQFASVPVTALASGSMNQPDTNKLTVILTNRYLSKIKEKKGVANFLVIDRKTGNKQYQTASFFASNVVVSPSESASIVKTNEGFTLYSPDHSPTTVSLSGSLLSGDNWGNARPAIGHTDWFSKMLTDYRDRLSATAAIKNDTDVWFSYEYFYAKVHVTSLQVGTSADTPTVHGFTMQMVVKQGNVIIRPDLDGSGPDQPPAQESLDKKTTADKSDSDLQKNNTGTAANALIGIEGAIAPSPSPDTLGAWSPDGQINPAFTPIVAANLSDVITDAIKDNPNK